jgi:hypothetical protein
VPRGSPCLQRTVTVVVVRFGWNSNGVGGQISSALLWGPDLLSLAIRMWLCPTFLSVPGGSG